MGAGGGQGQRKEKRGRRWFCGDDDDVPETRVGREGGAVGERKEEMEGAGEIEGEKGRGGGGRERGRECKREGWRKGGGGQAKQPQTSRH